MEQKSKGKTKQKKNEKEKKKGETEREVELLLSPQSLHNFDWTLSPRNVFQQVRTNLGSEKIPEIVSLKKQSTFNSIFTVENAVNITGDCYAA